MQTVIDRWTSWAGSHPEAGAVCVGSDHGEAVSRQVASAHGEGDEAGVVPGHKVLQRAGGNSNITDWSTERFRHLTLFYFLTRSDKFWLAFTKQTFFSPLHM